MTYKLILFDIDGTLINSFDVYRKIMGSLIPQYHSSTSIAKLHQTFPMTMEETLQVHHLSHIKVDTFRSSYHAEMKKHDYHEEPYPDVLYVLKNLKQHNISLGITTSRSDTDFYRLHPSSLRNIMDTVVTADSVSHRKPSPDPLLKAISQIGVSTNDVLYIGDANVDEQAAKSANIDFGLATWGANPSAKFHSAKFKLNNFKEILSLV
jgi:phosphoglycolate phosphatase